MKKIVINLLCRFIPVRKWRRKLRGKKTTSLAQEKRYFEEVVANFLQIKVKGLTLYGTNFAALREQVRAIILGDEYKFLNNKDFILIDVGANIGITSLYFSKDQHCRKIYAFEPFKETFKIGKKNLQANNTLASKIIMKNIGLSNENKTKRISFNPADQWTMSSLKNIFKDNEVNLAVENIVLRQSSEVVSDIISKHLNKKIFMKIDCEGAEHEILPELDENGILKKIDIIAMEYHYDNIYPYKNLIKILNKNDFVCIHNRIHDTHCGGMGIIKAIRND